MIDPRSPPPALLPSGTVTFLFTDIEGSTKLAQAYPDVLPALLARHHAILQRAIESHNGYVFQIIGDAFHAAFNTPRDALDAALDAQRMLQIEPWSPTAVKVRIGINTGAAQAGAVEQVAGGYMGYLTLTRVERVMALAHGGQILLSNATAELLRDELPPGVTLRDMQERHLKGFASPERVWQVDAPDLPREFPPLVSGNTIPHNLPQQLTSFVGRERELAEIKNLIRTTRLLTLTGPGGTGKTRLSLQTAAGVLENFSDGVWFVELAPVSDPALVPQTLAAALGLREESGQSPLELLVEYLRSKQLLLILDNCEHLVDACAQLADRLLHASQQLTILASSREGLGIAGEYIYRVPSLSIAELRQAQTIDAVLKNDCVRLFVERASAVQSGFHISDKNAASIAQICMRLDGIPLAIELAAARVKVMTPDQIAARLDDRFRLLTGGSRTALPRQQTLRALIDWSYDLLSEAERFLLGRLSVFVDGWTYEAAEQVCADSDLIPDIASRPTPPSLVRMGTGGLGPDDILDLLTHLVDKSLVTMEESDDGGARYRLLETIRQYARYKLLDSGEIVAVRDRHLQYYLGFGEQAWNKFFSVEQAEWSERVRAEQDNVRAALDWALEQQPDDALRLGSALSLYWSRSGYACSEGVHLLELALKTVAAQTIPADAAPDLQIYRARALLGLSWLARTLGDMATSKQFAESSITTWSKFEIQREWGLALIDFAVTSMFVGDPAAAVAAANQAISKFRTLQEPWLVAYALDVGAIVAVTLQRDTGKARAYLEESINTFRRLGDEQNIALPLWVLGELEYVAGNYEEARSAFKASLAGSLAAGHRHEANRARSGIASAEWRLGQHDAALNLFGKVMVEWQKLGNRGGVARCFELIAFVLIDRAGGEPARSAQLSSAASLLGAAEHAREITNAQMNPNEKIEYDQAIWQLRLKLDETTLQACWAEGRALTTEQAIELALHDE